MRKLLLMAIFCLLPVFTSNVYGAEALISIRNSVWQEGHCQDGAIIDIRPDGFEWGKKEKQKCIIIKAPDAMLKKREEARRSLVSGYDINGEPTNNGRLRYVYEYWNELDSETVKQIRTKSEDNIYIETGITLDKILEKDADNNTIGNLSIVSP